LIGTRPVEPVTQPLVALRIKHSDSVLSQLDLLLYGICGLLDGFLSALLP